MTGLENVLRSMFAAVEVSPEWFRIVWVNNTENGILIQQMERGRTTLSLYISFKVYRDQIEARYWDDLLSVALMGIALSVVITVDKIAICGRLNIRNVQLH